MLPSQTGRPSSSRAHMYRRTRRRRLPVVLLTIAGLMIAAVALKWWTGAGDVAPGMSSGGDSAAGPPPAATPATAVEEPSSRALISHVSSEPASAVSNSVAAPPPVPPATAKPSTERISMGEPPAALPMAAQPEAQTEPMKPAAQWSPGINTPAAPPRISAATPPQVNVQGAAESSKPASARIQAGLDLIAQNRPVEARRMLTVAHDSPGVSVADADRIRTELTRLNQMLLFSPTVVPGDPHTAVYSIESGDSLVRLPRKLGLSVDWRFLQRINNISSPERLQLGQRIKVAKGPFHAVVHKREYRMDLYMGDGDNRVYVRSFNVGLGEHNATPEGAFAVKPDSKLINPAWANPRTGEFFEPNDPKNPLGEYWIGLIGISDNIRDLESYGIHGTIEPESIGQMRSMGCVRMLEDDIALVYELLIDNASRIEVHGDEFP